MNYLIIVLILCLIFPIQAMAWMTLLIIAFKVLALFAKPISSAISSSTRGGQN